jgi:DNA-directed RNA polymerase specialized sigma24 family protein
MSSPGSVTLWISQLKAGARHAAQPLWENYFRRLVSRALHRLASVPRRAADEEDVALSAFDSFCRAAEQGRFPDLHDRDDLWRLLVVITDRKACDLVNHEGRGRRGGGKVLDEGALASGELARLVGPEPTPEFAAQAAENWQRLFGLLRDPELEKVALLKMEGYRVAEIAARLGCVPRTVQRRLHLIRRIWEQEGRSGV